MSKSTISEFKSAAGITMIRVPAGSFIMGSPEFEDGHRVWEQQREVTFVNDFYLGQTPVTQEQYEVVTGTNPTDHEVIRNAPVDSVNWDQANEYCQKLTTLDREAGVLPDGWEYRLPTEAEWEYACRAGNSEPRHGEPLEVAWHHKNADETPHAVGQKAPNAWGFHDMHGNVWEWCQDWFNPEYHRIRPDLSDNPTGPPSGTKRVQRGGSYLCHDSYCNRYRLSARIGNTPDSAGGNLGFRCARDLEARTAS